MKIAFLADNDLDQSIDKKLDFKRERIYVVINIHSIINHRINVIDIVYSFLLIFKANTDLLNEKIA